MLCDRNLSFCHKNPYIEPVGQPTMAINGLRNRCCGPGGGTRRLHHIQIWLADLPGQRGGFEFSKSVSDGGETGSTCTVKVYFSLGMISAVTGSITTNANDNRQAFAVAA